MLQTTALPGLCVPSMQMGAHKCNPHRISNIIIWNTWNQNKCTLLNPLSYTACKAWAKNRDIFIQTTWNLLVMMEMRSFKVAPKTKAPIHLKCALNFVCIVLTFKNGSSCGCSQKGCCHLGENIFTKKLTWKSLSPAKSDASRPLNVVLSGFHTLNIWWSWTSYEHLFELRTNQRWPCYCKKKLKL